jgi:hypothetical protein
MSTPPTPKQDDFLDQLLHNRYSGADTADDVSARSQAEAAIESISKDVKAGDSGGVRVLIGTRHANLGTITREFVESMIELGFSLIEPTGLSKIDAIRRLAMLLWKINDLVQKLDEVELLLCRGIAEISKRKQGKIFVEPGASSKELEKYFKSRGEMVPLRIDDKLEGLVDKHVLLRDRYDHGGPYYRIVF